MFVFVMKSAASGFHEEVASALKMIGLCHATLDLPLSRML